MSKRYIHLNDFINITITEKRHKSHYKFLLSEKEFQIALYMTDVLEPFHEATQVVSSSSKITISEIIPLILYIKTRLLIYDSDDSIYSHIKKFMRKSLDYYLEKYKLLENKLLLSATFLSPKCKNFNFARVKTASEEENEEIQNMYITKAVSALTLKQDDLIKSERKQPLHNQSTQANTQATQTKTQTPKENKIPKQIQKQHQHQIVKHQKF